MAQYLLGIDNGSTVTKAGLFTPEGREVAVAGREVETFSLHPGWKERKAEDMWSATCGAIRDVLEASKVDPAEIACVAPTGYGNGLYLLDAEGRALRNAIDSSDSRASAIVERWAEAGVGERVLPLTTQSLWPAQPNALLAWVRENEPDTMRQAAWVLMAKDYTRFRLTDRIQAELTDMSATSLMSVRDADYSMDVLEAFGLGEMRDLLPPLVRAEEVVGEVTAEAAAACGLKAGTPVAGGMFDIDACSLAAGIVDERQMSLVAGTWGNNQYIARTPLVDKDLFMTSCYCLPGHYLMLEGSPTSAVNLEWFVSEFFEAERAAARERGESVYDVCNALVEATPPGDGDLVFLPFLYGSNASPKAKGAFLGLEGRHTRGHVVRAIYEGIVFAHNMHLQRLLQFREAPETIRFTGGAARSRVWVQMFADCFQIPIEIPDGTELGALGAAIAAAVAVGLYPGYAEAVEAMTGIARRQEPNPAMRDLYARKYARYKDALSALDSYWK